MHVGPLLAWVLVGIVTEFQPDTTELDTDSPVDSANDSPVASTDSTEPTAVDPRAMTGPIEVAAPPEPERPLDHEATEPSAPTEAPAPSPAIGSPSVPAVPAPEATPQTPARFGTDPRIPRVLATIDGLPWDEQATISNKDGTVTFVPGLQFRNQIGFVSPFTIDARGNRYADGAMATGRVRWRPALLLGRGGPVRLVATVDFGNGRWSAGDSESSVIQEIVQDGQPPVPFGVRAVDPRELYLEWQSPVGLLRVGQMAFSWGLGMLTNDGNNVDRFGDMRFGFDGDGSIQERVLFATRPLARTDGPGRNVVMGLGADLVFRDPVADLVQGDLAGQGFLFVRWQPESAPGNWIGAYGVYRRQKSASDGDIYPDDRDLEIAAVDFAGQGFHYIRRDLALIGAFETVLIGGRTNFASNTGEFQQVLQAGVGARGYIGDPDHWLVGFDAGYASGDANPNDDEVNDFEAAPGYNAGLLMFQWVRGWQSARAQIQAEDETVFGVPRNGTQYLPTGGSVTNALYLQPKIRYAMLQQAEVFGGPMFAVAPAPIVDPYQTTIGGGSPQNSLGGNGNSRYLGTEIDLGVRMRYSFRHVWLMAGMQTGILFPGPGLRGPDSQYGDEVWGIWFRTELRY